MRLFDMSQITYTFTNNNVYVYVYVYVYVLRNVDLFF